MNFNLKSQLVADTSTTKKYADVYVHVAFKDIVKRFKAHKFVLAQHSKYFDNIFLSNESMPLVHICFSSVHPDIVENTLKVMYGYQVEILEKHLSRFKGFLDSLTIDYETIEVAVRDTNNEAKIAPPQYILPPPACVSTPSVSASADTVEQPAEVNMPKKRSQNPSKSTQDKKKKVEEATKTHQTTSMMIQKQLEALPAVDKWTETTEERLDDIDFKIEIYGNKGKFYKCDHCEYIHNLFTEAEKHFILKHQDCGNAPQIFEDAIKYYKKSSSSCTQIKEQMAGNCNKALAKNKLM